MKNILMIILAAAGAAVLVSAAGCGGEEVAEAPVRPVRAVLLQQTAGVETREFPAVVQPARETPVSFRVGGPILRMAVAQGDRIAAGDPIAVLDPRDYEIARAAAAARAAELQARLERIRGMYEDGNAARADLDRVQAGRDMAAAELEAAENALRDTRLLAPFAGVVGLELAEEGQIVKAGQPVATLMDEAGWEVRAGIPEGLMVSAADFSDFGVSLDSHPGREFPARLKELGDRPGAGLQSYPLVVTPELPRDVVVTSGMGARVRFSFAAGNAGGFVLPVSALFSPESDRSRVWIFDPETGEVASRAVELGDVAADGVVVRAGLRVGEWIVTAGAHRLTEGRRVRLLDDPSDTNVGGER